MESKTNWQEKMNQVNLIIKGTGDMLEQARISYPVHAVSQWDSNLIHSFIKIREKYGVDVYQN